MAKPTTIPRWADTVAGDVTKLNEPPNGKKDVGWLVAEKPPAQWLNWLFYWLYLWVVWLRDYEDTSHIWSQLQTYNRGISVSQAVLNSHGTITTGNGTGVGLWARGGANGGGVQGIGGVGAINAPGVLGQGDTTGANGGPGVRGEGGTQSPGGVFVGQGPGAGLTATGGSSGHGVVAQGNGGGLGADLTGGATNGNAIKATAGGAGHALQCAAGGIRLDDNTKSVAFTTTKTYTRGPTGIQSVDRNEWALSNGTHYQQNNAPSGAGSRTVLAYYFKIPAGAIITEITQRIDPAGGHVALPGVMPVWQAIDVDPATGSSTNIVSKTDASATVMAYEAAHDLTQTGLSYAVAAGHVIIVWTTGEQGPDEVDGLQSFMPLITYTRAQIGEE